MSAEFLGQFSTSDIKKLPLLLREGAMEYEQCYVVSVSIIGVMRDFDDSSVSPFFFGKQSSTLIRALKSILTLEELESFRPWLCYLFKSQQERLMAIMDEIHEEDDIVEVSL